MVSDLVNFHEKGWLLLAVDINGKNVLTIYKALRARMWVLDLLFKDGLGPYGHSLRRGKFSAMRKVI